MQRPRKCFESVDQARPWARKQGVRIRRVDVLGTSERGHVEEATPLLDRLGERVTARHEDGNLGIGGDHLVPGETPRSFTTGGEHGVSTRGFDHVRHPVAAAEWRVRPLERERARPVMLRDGAAHDVDACAQLVDHGTSTLLRVRGLTDHGDAFDHLVQRRRVERDHFRMTAEHFQRFFHRPGRHRTHLTEILRQDEIRLDVADALGVERIDRLAVGNARAHRVVDLLRAQRLVSVQRGTRHHRLRLRLSGVVALEGDPLERVAEPEREHDLGG